MAVMALFRHGDDVRTVDYTPGSAVAGGDVVVAGNVPLIAHGPIAANQKGAMACHGGVYRCTADGALGLNVVVYWDAAASKITATATANKLFGWTVSTSSTNGDAIDVMHHPRP